MNRNHLALFHAVAEAGSISRAAERLCISQPAVSKQIAEFERAFGMPLFDRLPRGVRLTEAGTLLESFARRLLATETEAEAAMRELAGLDRGRLALGASTSIGSYLLPPVLAVFHRAHPAIEIALRIANTEQIQVLLEEGGLDIGFTEGFIHSGNLDATVFRDDELVVIAPPDSPLARLGALSAERIAREPLVAREAGSGTREVVERAFAERGLTPTTTVSLGSTEAIKRAVIGGMGIGIVSRLAVADECAGGRLVVLSVPNLVIRRPLHRLLLKGRHIGRASRAFLRVLDRAAA